MKINLNPPLEEYRATQITRINQEAEAIRLQHITPGSGMAMTYMEKEREAREILKGKSDDSPHLTLEAGIRGLTIEVMAQTVLSTAKIWRQISAAIELLRQTHLKAAGDAKTILELRLAGQVDWSQIQT